MRQKTERHENAAERTIKDIRDGPLNRSWHANSASWTLQ